MTKDELISNAINGQLNEHERITFESRLREDGVLQHNLQITQFAIQAAQQLPVAALPRNFTLPASMAQPERTRSDWRFVFRVGSVIAAALFVVLVGLDLSAVLPRFSVQPTPAIASSPKERTQIGVIETVQLTGLPQAPRRPQITADGAEVVATVPQARATKSLNSLSKLIPTTVATAIPTALQTAIELTPMPTPASGVPSEISSTWATWPRALAGFALVLGAVLAFLGWRR